MYNRKQTYPVDRITRARLAAHAGLDIRTVDRALSGENKTPHPLTLRAIHDAARALGVSIPEPHTAGAK